MVRTDWEVRRRVSMMMGPWYFPDPAWMNLADFLPGSFVDAPERVRFFLDPDMVIPAGFTASLLAMPGRL